MNTMVISEFKAKCIATVKDVEKRHRPILLTIRGRPVAEVHPHTPVAPRRVLGAMRGSVKVHGDIVNGDSSGEWEMVSDPDRTLDPRKRK